MSSQLAEVHTADSNYGVIRLNVMAAAVWGMMWSTSHLTPTSRLL